MGCRRCAVSPALSFTEEALHARAARMGLLDEGGGMSARARSLAARSLVQDDNEVPDPPPVVEDDAVIVSFSIEHRGNVIAAVRQRIPIASFDLTGGESQHEPD